MDSPGNEGQSPKDAAADQTGTAEESLRAQMRTGVYFLGMGNALARLVKVGVHVALAWWLMASDYGLVAMTAAFMAVLQVLSEFGVGVAVIQKTEMSPAYASSAFWLNLIMSMALFAVTWLAAPWIAAFYHEPAITLLARVSALGFPITALRTIPMALMRRELRFGRYTTLDTFWQIASGLLACLLAATGAGYWSLVLPALIIGLAMTPFWFRASEWRPALTLSWAQFADVFSYAKYVVAVSLLFLILNNAGFLLVGRLYGPDEAGMFKFGTENAMFVVLNYAWLIGNVSLSGFAVRKAESDRLRAGYQRIYEILCASTLPVHALLYAAAPELFAAVFPDRWMDAVPIFRVLLIFAAFRALASHGTPFFNAIDRAHVSMAFYAVLMPICVTAMYVAGKWGSVMTLAWAGTITQTLGVFVLLSMTPYIMGWRKIPYIRIALPYTAAALAGAAAAKTLLVFALASSWHPLILMGLSAALGVATYLLVLRVAARRRLARLLEDALPQRISRRYAYFLSRLVGMPERG